MREPYSDPWKKRIGWLLGWLQKSSEAELLYQMHFKLYKHGMLFRGEPEPGQQQITGKTNQICVLAPWFLNVVFWSTLV